MQAQIPVSVTVPPSHSSVLPDMAEMANMDPRLLVFRKLSKTMKPAVLLKSWQRVCMMVAGIETSQEFGQASITVLEKEIYDRYHGNIHRDPPIIGSVKRAMDDQLGDLLATDKFGIKFPRDKISYVQMTTGMPGHTIWRYYKELITEVANKINMVYRSCLKEDMTFPDGKVLYDVLEDSLRILWNLNEELRKERAGKRLDESRPRVDETDSEPDPNDSALSLDDHLLGRKRSLGTMLLNTKAFPGVGRYQPIGFLTFLLMGAPAGEKCWNRFALDAHLECGPPRARVTAAPRSGRVISDAEDMNLDDFMTTRERKRGGSKGKDQLDDDENEAIRIYNAETTARAQRLEELKLALSLFPDDESIKTELKQFVDSQRRTALTTDHHHHHQYDGPIPGMFC